MQKIHDTFCDIFNDIGCFKGTFSLQLKPNSKPYQVPPWQVAYALQKPFKEELECLQMMDIITPLGVDEMAEWCNNFVWVPKANGKVRLCLDPVQLNQALIDVLCSCVNEDTSRLTWTLYLLILEHIYIQLNS